MQDELRKRFADHPLVGEVRGAGLVAAVELVADKATHRNFDAALKVGARAAKLCEANGVISRGLPGDALAFSPPLIITEADILDMVDRAGKAVDELAVQLRREQIAAVA
jgi:4-aminobutyrate--pyruvate transaminase